MKNIINLEDARKLAQKSLPKFAFDFVDGGAEDETTLRANQRAFGEVTFRPRVLVGVRERDTSTTVLGEKVKLPVVLAPAGGQRLICRQGELAATRAAGREGSIFVLSTGSNYTIEEVAAVATGPIWFQLYPVGSREDTAIMVERAQKAGYNALCLCVDTAVSGKRERDLRNKTVIPPRPSLNKVTHVLQRPLWLRHYLFGPALFPMNLVDLPFFKGRPRRDLWKYLRDVGFNNDILNWDDLAWLRDKWKGSLVIKGIMSAEDTKRALDHGVNGIVVSNHGGRQLEGLPATLDILPEVVAAVDGKAEVFIDGGIRRGSDVLKAIALGAKACLIGRPYIFGMAIGGEEGVAQILRILRGEIDRAMALLGCRSIAEVDRSIIRLKQAEPAR